ncbi:hypothetical protein B0J15DRAFT_460509 [Fusarium solani]|uniref:Uncharacterized protein n=1 Tax=Fusarium solani TaxID=169388 RepID=A0A9P9L2D7_FUSSL|nr:uncharacterized protein B0J15DRAFT_460509 [Fusarium solani]KAH7272772.1 hypothetical protein B0J15DRAFT_460509 [Fusarium solani]
MSSCCLLACFLDSKARRRRRDQDEGRGKSPSRTDYLLNTADRSRWTKHSHLAQTNAKPRADSQHRPTTQKKRAVEWTTATRAPSPLQSNMATTRSRPSCQPSHAAERAWPGDGPGRTVQDQQQRSVPGLSSIASGYGQRAHA